MNWALIWTLLVILALGYFTLLFWSLWTKTEPLIHQALRLGKQLESFASTSQVRVEVVPPNEATLRDLADVRRERDGLLAAKARAKRAKTRRLIRNKFEVSESEFFHAS